MPEENVYQNIKANRAPLLMIVAAAVVLGVFGIRGWAESEDAMACGGSITIALFKEGRTNSYYAEFQDSLEQALERNGWQVRFALDLSRQQVMDSLQSGEIHIAGEFSPLNYIENYERYEFQPFLALEYNRQSYYHSILFAPDRVNRPPRGHFLVDEIGSDNLGTILSALSPDGEGYIAIARDSGSTSGHLYPKSFLISNGVGTDRVKAEFDHNGIWQAVLDTTLRNNTFVGGFIADFRFRQITSKSTFDSTKYATPFELDKSDPIPQGLFVISNKAASNTDLHIQCLTRVWKTVRNIAFDCDTNSMLTGWRTGVERDLNLVQDHFDKVKYYKQYTSHDLMYLSVGIALLMIMVSVLSYAYLSKLE
jgi:ABC-type phosphate/phosphonate transport system substrate-binding protein